MFVESETELTTAATDLILAMQAFFAVILLRRRQIVKPMWTSVWTWFFGLLCFSSALGAVSHGVKMADSVENTIWMAVYLALGQMMALFVIAAVSMQWNHTLAQRCLPFGIMIAFAFFAITQFWSDSFLLFVVYEAFSMLLALGLYTASFWTRRKLGSEYFAAGILVGLMAALVDTQSHLHVTLWGIDFDNHGLFHLVQMLSLLLLTIGLHRSHLPQSDPPRIETPLENPQT
jgi:hypothetical protein